MLQSAHRTAPHGDLQDFDTYRAKVSQAVVPLDVQTGHPGTFRGRLEAAITGDIHLFDVRADAHVVHRTPALIEREAQKYLKFSLIEEGSGLIIQDGRETVLREGDMAFYDTDKPYSLVFDGWARMSIVMFPKTHLEIPAKLLAGLTAVRLDGASGVGALIRPYLSTLTHQIGEVDGHVARRLFRTAFELVGTLIEDNMSEVADSTHESLLRRIYDYIDANLAQPDLNPGQIAAAHFISVRHLHSIFSDQSVSVSSAIRSRRLERCYDELLNPLLASRSVTSIGFANGFVDAAHFSRTFRSHFGFPPSALRREKTPEVV